MLATLLGTPLAAGAQNPPPKAPPAPPAPVAPIAPRLEPMLLDPLVLDLSPPARRAGLRVQGLDDARLLALDGRLLDVAAIGDLQRDAIEQARDAMEQARV